MAITRHLGSVFVDGCIYISVQLSYAEKALTQTLYKTMLFHRPNSFNPMPAQGPFMRHSAELKRVAPLQSWMSHTAPRHSQPIRNNTKKSYKMCLQFNWLK